VVGVHENFDGVLVGEKTAGDVLEDGPASAFGHGVVFGGAGGDVLLKAGALHGLDGVDGADDGGDICEWRWY
jgi:hypothetical protein